MTAASTSALLLEARDRLRQRKRLNEPLYNAVKTAKEIPKDSREKMLAAHHALMEAAAKSGKRLTDWDRSYCQEHKIKTQGGYTKNEIAKSIGIAPVNLNKHLRKENAPKPVNGRYDLEQVAEFIAGEQAKDNRLKNMTPDAVQAKADLLIYKAKQAQLKYEREAGLVVSREEAEAKMYDMCLVVRYKLQAIPHKLPPMLEGKTLPQMSDLLEREIRDILRDMATGDDARDAEIINMVEASYESKQEKANAKA